MKLWWFLFVCDLLIPITCIVAGRMMWKHCPRNINALFGYRTRRSMQNMDTWKFAHEHCGRLWWNGGWILLLLSALVQVPFFHSREAVIGTVSTVLMCLQCILLVISVFPTEAALKKAFDENGNRR